MPAREPQQKESLRARPSRQSEPRLLRHGRHHPTLALRPRRRHARCQYGDPIIVRRDARARSIPRPSSPATSSASASTPATPCAATKSAARRARAAPGSCSAASTRRSIPDEAHELGGAHASSKATATSIWPHGARRLRRRAAPAASTTAAASPATIVLAGALGSAAARSLHVGLGADRARVPEALLVLLGLADRRAEAAAARRRRASSHEIVELRRRGFRFIALADDNFYPVHARRSRSRPSAAPIQHACTSSKRSAQERFELMARLAQLPDDMVFFTQITMEAAEDPDVSRRDAPRAHPRRAGRRRVGDARRSEGRLQGLQPRRRSARRAAADVPGRTASTCSARSSSACRRDRAADLRRHRRPRASARTSRSRSSSC